MKEAISQMEMHLGAAAKISATLDFKRGFGNKDCVSTVNIPTPEPTDLEPGQIQVQHWTVQHWPPLQCHPRLHRPQCPLQPLLVLLLPPPPQQQK